MKYFLCLGSNIGNRGKNLEAALLRIKEHGIKVLSCSSLYETEPVGMPGERWFFNQVIELETDLTPSKLLAWIKQSEKKMGRDLAEKHKSRIIDMDILFAERRVIHTEELCVPHPELAARNFVLIPLAEIAPELIHPVLNKKIRSLLLESKDSHCVKIVEGAK